MCFVKEVIESYIFLIKNSVNESMLMDQEISKYKDGWHIGVANIGWFYFTTTPAVFEQTTTVLMIDHPHTFITTWLTTQTTTYITNNQQNIQ